jgi:hypothetical protein
MTKCRAECDPPSKVNARRYGANPWDFQSRENVDESDEAGRLHVTGVPFPHVLGNEGLKIGRAHVGDPGREAEQTPRFQVPAVRVVLLHLVGGGGQAILLHGALQKEQLAILQMGRPHHFVVIRNQIRHFCPDGKKKIK